MKRSEAHGKIFTQATTTKLGGKTICRFKWHPGKGEKPMRWFENPAVIMTAATVSHWTMASLVSVYRASLILCVAPGSGIGFCRVLRLYKLKSPVPKDWSDAQNVVRRFWQNPTAPNIVPIVPARYTAVRKRQVTGNVGRIRTNRASKSRIYARFPARQSWRWIAIPLIA